MPATEPAPVSLAALALRAVAEALARVDAAEHAALAPLCAEAPTSAAGRRVALDLALEAPHPDDRALARLAAALGLDPAERLAVQLAAAVDHHLAAGRAVARLQAPIGGARPTLGLLASILGPLTPGDLVDRIAHGPAIQSGLLTLGAPGAPLPERPIAVPPHLLVALAGRDPRVPGASPALDVPVPLTPSIRDEAARHARALGPDAALAVRSASPTEARAAAAALAAAAGRRALFIDGDPPVGLGPWLILADLWPAFTYDLGPDERAALPDIPGYSGPRLALCGVDGRVTHRAETVAGWCVPLPPVPERAALWRAVIDDPDAAAALAVAHRQGPGRIAELGRHAARRAAADERRRPTHADVVAAARAGDAGGLDALAHPLREAVGDDVLVLPPDVERDLDTLLLRCRHREGLHADLGPATSARYHPGVRALLVGPSGTGKTLAAAWLATRLGLPLYRVDTASIISKYIGETEKNLARLLAVAEHAEVVLLFDEADALFGKRTEVRHANDRFANAQTNYLLQRIETFAGITLLTSNSRTRFDDAFTRRLDLIIEFSLPGPHERRALWKNHLGDTHALDPRQLNQLAATSDLAGGHIRNVVLAAAVHARHAGRPIDWPDILRGLAVEYRKLGRQVPAGLRETP